MNAAAEAVDEDADAGPVKEVIEELCLEWLFAEEVIEELCLEWLFEEEVGLEYLVGAVDEDADAGTTDEGVVDDHGQEGMGAEEVAAGDGAAAAMGERQSRLVANFDGAFGVRQVLHW